MRCHMKKGLQQKALPERCHWTVEDLHRRPLQRPRRRRKLHAYNRGGTQECYGGTSNGDR